MQLWKHLFGCYDRGCARNMKMLRANRGGGWVDLVFRAFDRAKKVQGLIGLGGPALSLGPHNP